MATAKPWPTTPGAATEGRSAGPGPTRTNTLYGDGQSMADDTRGGNDRLIGAAGPNTFNSLWGDADFMTGNARGGNDTLVGGDAAPTNFLFGDGFEMRDNARGGNDTLIS